MTVRSWRIFIIFPFKSLVALLAVSFRHFFFLFPPRKVRGKEKKET